MNSNGVEKKKKFKPRKKVVRKEGKLINTFGGSLGGNRVLPDQNKPFLSEGILALLWDGGPPWGRVGEAESRFRNVDVAHDGWEAGDELFRGGSVLFSELRLREHLKT